MIVLADGSYLPYTFAAGDTLAITSLDGAWFVTDGTDDYIIDWAGTPAIISGIYQAGALLIEAYILDTNGKITFTEVSGLYTTPYVFAAGDHAVLGMNIPSGGAGQGYLLVKCEVTIAPVFDWTLVIPLQSGQPGVDITSAGYCSDQGTEGYGADTTVSNNITFQLHISGMDLATVCQQIDIEYTWLSFSTPSSVIELVFEGGYTVTIPVGSGYPASGSYSTGLITYNIGIGVGGYATAHLLNFALAIDYDHWAPNPKGVVAIKSVTLHGSGTPPTL